MNLNVGNVGNNNLERNALSHVRREKEVTMCVYITAIGVHFHSRLLMLYYR